LTVEVGLKRKKRILSRNTEKLTLSMGDVVATKLHRDMILGVTLPENWFASNEEKKV
jgi:hypothetical protein